MDVWQPLRGAVGRGPYAGPGHAGQPRGSQVRGTVQEWAEVSGYYCCALGLAVRLSMKLMLLCLFGRDIILLLTILSVWATYYTYNLH